MATDPKALRTPLARKIASIIAASGPISIADYVALCLADPDFGYYRSREPFGRSGDFVTAPEITQLFGEMLAVFFIEGWQRQGRIAPVRLVEIGPGRGTLMRDMLRVIEAVAPALWSGIEIHMVETSARLTTIQQKTLGRYVARCHWHDTLDDVPSGYSLIVANELFDALPFRQFAKTESGFRERVVGLNDDGGLVFGLGTADLDETALPADPGAQPLGTIFELAPAREAVAAAIGERLAEDDGIALVIDYGHLTSSYGDTLQALHSQAFDDPLAHPGEADLTSHVDFSALAAAAIDAGASVAGLARQGEFLLALGLLERAGRLGSGKDSLSQSAIRTAVERIAGEGEGAMGELFKVMALTGKAARLPPFCRDGKRGDGRRGTNRN